MYVAFLYRGVWMDTKFCRTQTSFCIVVVASSKQETLTRQLSYVACVRFIV